eukprot:TRINITY_DN8839_c0_g1_i2.p1 TRINITY_DN8839_c0_g1~~TRINITY_DN8839_c0_g1_i2.p1  ORF type:complete len:201 (-),score=10.80 TRINITY_DN8839_c0_g1_i2:125-727(-)
MKQELSTSSFVLNTLGIEDPQLCYQYTAKNNNTSIDLIMDTSSAEKSDRDAIIHFAQLLKSLYTLERVSNEGLCTTTTFTFSETKSSSAIQVQGKTVIKNTYCGYDRAISEEGWSAGVHSWTVRDCRLGCYGTIGIVADCHASGTLGGRGSWGLGVYPGPIDTMNRKSNLRIQFLRLIRFTNASWTWTNANSPFVITPKL